MLRPPVQVMRPSRVAKLPVRMAGGAKYEVKLDGWRVLAFIDEHGVTLQARSGRDVTLRFPEVLDALATLPAGTVLDGEIVAVKDGVFDFHALAGRASQRRKNGVAVSYVAFDLLAHAGHDIRQLPLSERWPRLLQVLDGAPVQVQHVHHGSRGGRGVDGGARPGRHRGGCREVA